MQNSLLEDSIARGLSRPVNISLSRVIPALWGNDLVCKVIHCAIAHLLGEGAFIPWL